jgi:hypothetical protein
VHEKDVEIIYPVKQKKAGQVLAFLFCIDYHTG